GITRLGTLVRHSGKAHPADWPGSLSSAMFSSSTLTPGSPRNPSARDLVYCATSPLTTLTGRCRAAATRAVWSAAFCGEMYGSSPDADVVTASGGTCDGDTWLNA